MQGRRPAGHGAHGEWQPRGSISSIRLLTPRTPAQLPPLQPLQEVPVGPLRGHGVLTHGHPTAPGVPKPGGAGARPLQGRERDVGVVAGIEHRIGQDELLRIASEGVRRGVPGVRLPLRGRGRILGVLLL